MISTLALLLLLSTAQVHSQILAIDFGTQYIKAAVVHSGAGRAFSIVENPKSERKFVNSLGLYNEERLYESESLTKRSRIPENCFLFSRLLVDLTGDPIKLETVKTNLLLDYINDTTSDQLLAEYVINSLPKDVKQVSLLQVVSMIMRYVKLQAQKVAKTTIKDAVLTIPNFWNLQQRNFIIHAAEIAQLSVISVVTENVGAAINFATSQRSSNQSHIVLLYNVGSSAFQMTLVEFKQIKSSKSSKPIDQIHVIGEYGQTYVGGLRLDSLICNYFVKKFQEKYKKSLNKRGLIRLLSESSKVKEMLSANKEASVFVQGIMDGIDFHCSITRSEFQTIAQEILNTLISPIRRFLLQHDLRPEEVHYVEMIGGSTRIPKLQALIGEIFATNKTEVGTHINGDEAMVLGAAFYGANSSKRFKVKGLNLYDGFDFQMRLVLRNSDTQISPDSDQYFFKNVTLFKKKSRFGINKQVNFKCKQNLLVDLYQETDSGMTLIKSYEINSIADFKEVDFKLSLIFTVDPIDIVLLKNVKAVYNKEEVTTYMEKVKRRKENDTVTDINEDKDLSPVVKSEEKQEENNKQNKKKYKQEDKQEDKAQEKNEESVKKENIETPKEASSESDTAESEEGEERQNNNADNQEVTENSDASDTSDTSDSQETSQTSESSESSQTQSTAQAQEKVETQKSEAESSKEETSSSEQTKKQQTQTIKSQSSDNTKTKESNENKKTSKASSKSKKKDKQEYQTVQRNKTTIKKFEKDIQKQLLFEIFPKRSPVQLLISRQLLLTYEKQQEKKRKLSESKNKLQALIYQIADKLQLEDFTKYTKDTEIEELKSKMDTKRSWYEESTSSKIEDYDDHHRQLNEPVAAIKRRITEHRERQDVFKRANDILEEYMQLTEKIQKSKEWITDQEKQQLMEFIGKKGKQIEQMHKSMKNSEINEDSTYRNKDMIKLAEEAKDKYFVLKTKPKPKKTQKKKEKESVSDSSQNKKKSRIEAEEL